MSRRPQTASPDVDELRDWLAANGIDEYIPEDPTLIVGPDVITYTAFRWSGPRGWNAGNIAVPERPGDVDLRTEERTVPLVVPVTERVRELCGLLSVVLVETEQPA